MESDKEQLLMYGVANIQHIRENSFWEKVQMKNLNILDHYTRHNFIREVYLWIAKNHQNYFYTNKYWDAFAKKHNYPDSNKYRKVFSKWEIAKQLVHGELSEFEMRQKFLLEIAAKYKIEFFEKHKEWDDFARRMDLPTTATYKNHFSNSYLHFIERILVGEMTDYHDLNVLRKLSKQFKQSKQSKQSQSGTLPKPKGITKEGLTAILIENKEYVATQNLWVYHAKQNNLPQLSGIYRHFGSFNGMKTELGLMDVFRGKVYSPEELIQLGIEHHAYLKPPLWGIFHEIYNLPGIEVIQSNFGRFSNFKQIVDQKIEKTLFMKTELGFKDVFSRKVYSPEDLIQLGIEHHAYLKPRLWEVFHKLHNLPGVNVIRSNFVTFSKYEQIVNLEIQKSLFNQKMDILIGYYEEHQELIRKIKPYWAATKLKKEWNVISKQHQLPDYDHIIAKFRSLKNLRSTIFLSFVMDKPSLFTQESWDNYAIENGLPLRKEYYRNFYNKITFLEKYLNINQKEEEKEKLILLLKVHYKAFSTYSQSKWKKYAFKHGLPSYHTISRVFGSWNAAKQALGVRELRININSRKELIELTKPHLAHFTKLTDWISYAKEHGLPSIATYNKYFGSFNKAKEAFGIKKVRNRKYTKEELIELTKPHLAYFTKMNDWTTYAREHGLPSIAQYNKYFGSFNNAKEALGLDVKNVKLLQKLSSREKLIELTKPHLAHFTTISNWILYAKKNGLPSKSTYIRYFGSFNKAKEAFGIPITKR